VIPIARRLDLQDRAGKSKEMIQRKLRLTEAENEKLNYLIEAKGKTLRDTVVELVEEEIKKMK
jgi:dsDNA-specific endonuclease/ATPase MutS2